jgi:hypothetical protein
VPNLARQEQFLILLEEHKRIMGNVHLKWAFSEAAVLFLRHTKDGKKLLAAIEKKHGKGKALSILAYKIGRAVFYMLSRGTVFSTEKFRAA